MTLNEFLAVFTTNDPVGGRAIKATFDSGIDDIENYLTKSDPAGGRAIKIVNTGSPLGPQFWAEAYSATTQATSSWTPAGAATNINAAIIPKGTGAIVADIPDGTATGGNARGAYAVDLQIIRNAATQVASGVSSFVGGGQNNTANAEGSSVVAGFQNTASRTYSAIVGGTYNGASGFYSFVGAGYGNSASGSDASVCVGGVGNSSQSQAAFVGAGNANTANNQYATITGGQSNTASGQWSTIAGGRQNTVSNTYATIAGGYLNQATGYTSFIGGGEQNFIQSVSTGGNTIAGGVLNSLAGTDNTAFRFIGGGTRNTINANQTPGATICGGNGNTIYEGSGGGIICGGGNAAFPGGNFLAGPNAAIVGGVNNQIGNKANYTGATGAFIGGGESNIISQDANFSSILGGSNNNINTNVGCATVTGGAHATAALFGQQVHASGRFSANGDAQAHELIWRRAVTGTSAAELFLDGASIRAILPGTNSIWHGTIDAVAVCTVTGDGSTTVGHVEATSFKVTIKRIGTATSLVGTVQEIGTTNADASMATGVFSIDNDDTNEALRIRFTPPATAGSTTTIRAVATFRGTQIQY